MTTANPRKDGLLGEWDRTEVQTADDLAAHRADEFLAMAMLDHTQRTAGQQQHTRGVCLFCDERCHPMAVYCDADCRDGHEAELDARRRHGRPGASE